MSWNKPFKEFYRGKYEEWIASGEKTYTAGGNMRAPEKILCLQWVKEAWHSVTTAVIQKSFEVCGISVNTDGSQDDRIHCLKDNGVATDAKPKVEELTKKLLEKDDDSDPFDDIEIEEDEDELENNEIIIDGTPSDCGECVSQGSSKESSEE